jgi:hypothetical protein
MQHDGVVVEVTRRAVVVAVTGDNVRGNAVNECAVAVEKPAALLRSLGF